MSYLADAARHIADFEGFVPHLYCDHLGNPTIGFGFLVRDKAALQRLVGRSCVTAEGDLATLEGLPPSRKFNKRAAYFADMTGYRMSRDRGLQLLGDYLVGAVLRLQKDVPGYADFPLPAQTALLDMSYNLGHYGLVNGFPKLIAACSTGDWATAAAECRRKTSTARRNKATAALFRKAGRDAR